MITFINHVSLTEPHCVSVFTWIKNTFSWSRGHLEVLSNGKDTAAVFGFTGLIANVKLYI